MTDTQAEYFLVKLRKGPAWQPGTSRALLGLQIRHMRNLWRLRRRGLAVMATPVRGDGDVRGFVILKASTEQEARAAMDDDPAVVAGRLVFDVQRL